MHKIRFWARHKAHALSCNPFAGDAQPPTIPLSSKAVYPEDALSKPSTRRRFQDLEARQVKAGPRDNVVDNRDPSVPPPAPPPPEGNASASIDESDVKALPMYLSFYRTTKMILFSSWLNVLLVFVPVGIAVEYSHVSPTAIFVINAIAIVPLAGLLSFATESAARRMGDTIGALMNVTFGNAVELIIFILALVKNEIRIVQASLLGSILANLLLILGMCFLWGGLRFREQIYNSTVTQISASLLCLSVMSLLLPTAFHASFTDHDIADRAVLQVSRGTSVILLLVYVLYLLFQLKSHAYIYQSTSQDRIDEESHPGFLTNIMRPSSSSDSSSSTSSADTDHSSSSNNTLQQRFTKAFRKGRRRRKSSSSSKGTPVMTPAFREANGANGRSDDPAAATAQGSPFQGVLRQDYGLQEIGSGDEADIDTRMTRAGRRHREKGVNFEGLEPAESEAKPARRKHRKRSSRADAEKGEASFAEKRRTDSLGAHASSTAGKPISLPNGSPAKLSNSPPPQSTKPFSRLHLSLPASLGRDPYGIRRTASLPDRLNQQNGSAALPMGPRSSFVPVTGSGLSLDAKGGDSTKDKVSKTTAVIVLLVSTGLVALCAEFVVGSIDALVEDTGVSAAFVGLIILPIVGNAAEHITAVTVAAKNKMDLAIGVALGSSIQIALFITPVIVLLGWILGKEMSLYFSLFETISLFVSAFIVNFLVLDGRSNYLEGALLIASYVMIGVASFFHPDSSQQSTLSGPSN